MNRSEIKKVAFNNRSLIEKIFIFAPIALFLFYKLTSLEYRFGDGNAYFYMADALLKGLIPYQDFLLADPPLLIYLLALVKIIIGDKLVLFLALPPLLEAISSFVIYLNLKKQGFKFAFLAPIIYLFSFLIISTSDYVTGLHMVLLLINLALLFEKKPFLSGVFWGLATLIKLYTIPGFIAFVGWLVYKKQYRSLFKIIIGYCLTGLLVMLPFLLVAPMQVVDQIIIHQFNRPVGISKQRIFTFFFVNDLLLIFLGLVGLTKKKNWQYLFFATAWIFFYLIFKDLYYVYLGVLAPWLAIGAIECLEMVSNKWQIDNLGKKLAISLVLLLFLSHLPALRFYHQNIRLEGRFVQAEEVANYVKNLEPEVPLYGSHEIAPLIALITNKSLFGNYMDTNAQIFSSGTLDIKQVSQEAVKKGVYLLVKVANLEINQKIDSGFEGYFDREIFEQYCKRLTIIDGLKHEVFTDVGVYKCNKVNQ